MKDLVAQWTKWSAAFLALSQREKRIVAAAAVLVPLVLGFNLSIDSNLTAARKANALISQQATELTTLQSQITVLGGSSGANADPNAAMHARLKQITADIAAADERLGQVTQAIVPPERVRNLLEGLLAGNPRLELISLRSLPTEPLETTANSPVGAGNTPPNQASRNLSGIYRHGIEIKIAGTYPDLQRWIGDLEARPERLLWQSLELKTETYPRAAMTLDLFSLSLNPTWMKL